MQRCNFSSQILLLAKKKKVTCTNKPAARFKNLPFSDVYSAWQRTTQNPQKAGGMEERLGQGWPTVCVSLWSCSDYWLTTPWTHLLVSTCSTGKITTTDLKMTLGCLFLRCGESTGKKKTTTNWSESKSESGKATKRLSEPKQTTSQMQLLRRYRGRRRLAHNLLIVADSPSRSSSKSSTKNSRSGGRFGLFRVLSSCWILEETRLLTATPTQLD